MPTRQTASHLVKSAVEKGELIRPGVCELCGSTEVTHSYQNHFKRTVKRSSIIAHHWNGYDHPLDIWWICRSCNRALAGEYFHSGQVTKEEARQFAVARHAKVPTGKCKGLVMGIWPCTRNTYDGNDYCRQHQKKAE